MLTMVEIQNALGDTLQLPLMDSSGGYVVKDIDGLDPVTANLVSTTMAQVDGAQFQSANLPTRNITMKLGLEPDYSVSSVSTLRTNLYDYLLPESQININFYLDGSLFATAAGVVESCLSPMFTDEPEADVSIICYDPKFYAPGLVTVSASTVPDLTTQVITYSGTSTTGVIFTLNINRTLSGFTLYNIHPDNTSEMFDVSGSFVSGDVVTLTTIPGSKSLILTRSNLQTSLLNDMTPGSDWISLMKGDNILRAYAAGAAVPFTLSYTPKYAAL